MKKGRDLRIPFSGVSYPCLVSPSFLSLSLVVSLSSPWPLCPFAICVFSSPGRPFSLSSSLSLLLLLLRLAPTRAFAKVQHAEVFQSVDDQRGFPFSTPSCCCCCCCAASPPPSFSLPSSSLFSRALGTTGMIILRERIRRRLHEKERLSSSSSSESTHSRYNIEGDLSRLHLRVFSRGTNTAIDVTFIHS